MHCLAIALALFVAFWCGAAFEMTRRPPPIVYVTKAEPARCDLIDRINKRKEKRT